MKKQVKFYLHHDHFEQVDWQRPQGLWGWFKYGLGRGLQLVFEIFYHVGLGLINLVLLPKRLLRLPGQLPNPKKIRNSFPSYRRSLAIFTSLALSVALIIGGGNLVASGQRLKGRVLGASDSGLSYLNEAQQALQQQDITRADQNLTAALDAFENSEQQLNSTSVVLHGLLAVIPQKQDADNLLEAAKLITEAGKSGTQVLAIMQQLKISQDGIAGSASPSEDLKQLQTLIDTSAEKIAAAADLINKVNPLVLPGDKQATFLAARDALATTQNSLQTLRDGSDLLFQIILGQKNVLLVFQNNNELRATGGFMGTIGTANLTDGQIKHLDIRSVYDYDGQLNDLIWPPQPMRAVNDRWFLRDSNWFADFPTSASRLSVMFEKEGGETPDMIMALTPDLIINLLRRTGPITMPGYGVTLNADNFVETIQTSTSIAYDKQNNQPKQLLADFFPLLLQRLSSADQGGLIALLGVLQTSLHNKDILLFSRDPELENKIESFNWGGQVRATDRDYLNIVSSNLGGTKTDRFLIRKINLQTDVNANGTVTDTLTYSVTNPLPQQDGLNNTSFVRFLVPKGAKLQQSSGFDSMELPSLSGDNYHPDSVVAQWESNLSRDSSGMYIGEEAGKTMLGNWIKLAGGETKTVMLKYQLPFSLRSADRLSLLLQKQSGMNDVNFSYQINFPDRNLLWTAAGNQADHQLTYQADLNNDLFFGQVFAKP